MNRLRAFTVVETLITMILFVLVSTMGLLVYQLVNKEFNFIRKSEAANNDAQYFQSFMENKFQKSNLIFMENNTLNFISNNDTTSVTFDSTTTILFNNIRRDTLNVEINDIVYKLDKLLVENGGFVNNMNCVLTMNQQLFQLTYQKLYGADFYMNQVNPKTN